MALVKVSEIADRLGIARCTAWRWSRRGRFGEPVDRRSGSWKFVDDGSLALMLQNCRWREPMRVWRLAEGRQYHARRLAGYLDGVLETDPEDLEMASLLLNIAARQFERRAAGKSSRCTVSAEFVGRQMLRRNKAHDHGLGEQLSGTAAALATMAKSGNGRVPGE
ncbi:MAG: hypothetical protein WCQ16_06820 [Verrucomicrobiae bacterium]